MIYDFQIFSYFLIHLFGFICCSGMSLDSLSSFCFLNIRLSTSDKMLLTIKEMIDRADRMKELDKEHQKEVKEKIELAKKFLQNKVS